MLTVEELLASGPMPIDGGLASELEERGHVLTDRLWSARILVDEPEEILAVHRSFVEVGARVLISASYQVSREGFRSVGRTAEQADAALRRSIDLARRAAADQALVAASVGPFGATLHDGSEYRGRYGVPHRQLVDFHAERLAVLAAAAPDLLAIETIPDLDEVTAIVEALHDFGGIPAWITMSCADGRHTSAGQPIDQVVPLVASAPSVRAIGLNCTAPEYVDSLLGCLAGATELPLVAYPNAGRGWDPQDGWQGEARTFADEVIGAWSARAALIGGCCGVGPAGIGRIAAALGQAGPQAD